MWNVRYNSKFSVVLMSFAHIICMIMKTNESKKINIRKKRRNTFVGYIFILNEVTYNINILCNKKIYQYMK